MATTNTYTDLIAYVDARLTALRADISQLEAIKAALSATPVTPIPDPPKPPDPPVVIPPTTPKALTILPPSFVDGLLTWKSEGGDGTKVEFMANGVSNWTDKPVRVGYMDQNFGPITIQARQSGKSATSLVFDLRKNQVITSPVIIPPIDKPDTKPTTPIAGTGVPANMDISDAVSIQYYDITTGNEQ